MVLPGLNSVIVPLASVVVVVVVVCETCPHANGATNANAMLKSIFFMFSPFFGYCGNDTRPLSAFRLEGRELAATPDSDAICAAAVRQQSLMRLKPRLAQAILAFNRPNEILDRHLRLSVHRVERKFLPGGFAHSQDAAVLRRAIFHYRDQLHLSSHSSA